MSLSLSVCACGSSNSGPQPGDNQTWHASYSQLFLGGEPGQTRLQVFVTRDVEDPCALFDDDSGPPPDGFEFLRVVTGVPAAGEHNAAIDESELGVSLESVREGTTATRVNAVAGTIGVGSEPDWQVGGELPLQLNPEFPRKPIQVLACEGSASEQGSSEQCDCLRDDGSAFSCDNTGVHHGACCHEAIDLSDTQTYSVSVIATYCQRMCSAATGWGHLCH